MKVLFAKDISSTVRIGLEWKLADLWIGGFYARKGDTLHIWVCLLPCLPVHIEVAK